MTAVFSKERWDGEDWVSTEIIDFKIENIVVQAVTIPDPNPSNSSNEEEILIDVSAGDQ
ncbi:hypothetical protein [Oceanobacillus sp. CAU 1775]